MATTTASPLDAATSDRLSRMFRVAMAYTDERDDVARAYYALEQTGRGQNGAAYLMALMTRLSLAADDVPVGIRHEERVSLYVASKVLLRA
mgnify:CR=1 FL=1